MTKEEILRKHLQENEHHSDKLPDMFTRFLIYDAMDEYAQQQLKILNIPVVVGRSEQLCLACNKEPATHGIGQTKTVCGKCWNTIVS